MAAEHECSPRLGGCASCRRWYVTELECGMDGYGEVSAYAGMILAEKIAAFEETIAMGWRACVLLASAREEEAGQAASDDAFEAGELGDDARSRRLRDESIAHYEEALRLRLCANAEVYP